MRVVLRILQHALDEVRRDDVRVVAEDVVNLLCLLRQINALLAAQGLDRKVCSRYDKRSACLAGFWGKVLVAETLAKTLGKLWCFMVFWFMSASLCPGGSSGLR